MDDVRVRRKVFDVAGHVEAFADDPAFHFAEMVRDAYRRHGEDDKAALWQEVRDFLFMSMCADKGVRIVIEPD